MICHKYSCFAKKNAVAAISTMRTEGRKHDPKIIKRHTFVSKTSRSFTEPFKKFTSQLFKSVFCSLTCETSTYDVSRFAELCAPSVVGFEACLFK